MRAHSLVRLSPFSSPPTPHHPPHILYLTNTEWVCTAAGLTIHGASHPPSGSTWYRSRHQSTLAHSRSTAPLLPRHPCCDVRPSLPSLPPPLNPHFRANERPWRQAALHGPPPPHPLHRSIHRDVHVCIHMCLDRRLRRHLFSQRLDVYTNLWTVETYACETRATSSTAVSASMQGRKRGAKRTRRTGMSRTFVWDLSSPTCS